eukprot:scaffold8345_cov121-Isochrysis_galbana.AAC.3
MPRGLGKVATHNPRTMENNSIKIQQLSSHPKGLPPPPPLQTSNTSHTDGLEPTIGSPINRLRAAFATNM